MGTTPSNVAGVNGRKDLLQLLRQHGSCEKTNMPPKIILKVSRGALSGREFVFDETSSCIVGRASDCSPRLPTDEAHRTVSRHHCLLDINPPDIRVRDFGSLNGTYVNGRKIGQRQKGMSAEDGAKLSFPEHDLKHGDEVRVGDNIFQVEIFVPAQCAECSAEITPEKKLDAERLPGVFQCESCRKKAALAQRKEPPKKKVKVCAKCGRDVAAEIGENRQGDYVCTQCQKDALEILKGMLDKAKAGVRELEAIRGYTIERELGRGGMGVVWLARNEASRELVALKVMLPKVAADERAKQSFLREVANTRALKHRNIVEFREAGCSYGTFFFTIEFCAQGSVDKLMQQRGGKLSVKEAMAIIRDVLDGLAYAHLATIPNVKLKDGRYAEGHGLTHRDLSPHNILLADVRGTRIAKISDFGMSRAFDLAGLSGLARTGTAAGKPWFMPRQQVVNFKYAGPEVDMWAAAASLYNMLTGECPRDFPRGKDVWQVVLESEPVPIRRRDSRIPARLAEVIDKALIDRPDIVFKTAAELKKALEAAL
ncbi:MAG: protein kinase [Terriglobia bacterium]